MDFINKVTGGNSSGNDKRDENKNESSSSSSGGGGGFMDKLNSAAGGGKQGEKNEDALDKGIDFVQEKFLGQGPQDNESAAEQAKDEAISDFVRGQYKSTTGSDFPIEDKDKKYGF
ncbi:hypothetical protein N3K66_000127 [Trichothecium roseum]|uniref:Uncharacterized protein n=1 Tax=Trichothecium roseum TaxID=47278 RepID=A0ACC0VBU0_9HYPO|nr:hypothetical protein N3K66_000127 [Trichothecium roseum]